VIANFSEHAGETFDVRTCQWLEEHLIEQSDVTGEYSPKEAPTVVGDRHSDAAFVVGGGCTGDKPALLKCLRLVCQAASAVHDTICQICHSLRSVGGIAQSSKQLKLHVTETSRIPQLLLDCMTQKAAHLNQREVRAQFCGIKRT